MLKKEYSYASTSPLGIRSLLYGELYILPLTETACLLFQVITVVFMEIEIFRGVRLFLGMYLRTFRKMIITSLLNIQHSCLTLTMRALRSVEIRGAVYPNSKGAHTRRHGSLSGMPSVWARTESLCVIGILVLSGPWHVQAVNRRTVVAETRVLY